MTDLERVRYRRSPGALWRRTGSAVVVTTASDPEVHELLGGASLMWSELAHSLTMSELLERLTAMHDVSVDVIEEQVSDALASMVDLGVVEEVMGSRD